MEIIFTEQFEQNIAKRLYFSKSHIREAILSRDEVEYIEFEGKTLDIYKKKIALSEGRSFHWLVLAEKGGNILRIYSAFRVYPDIVKGIEEMNSRAILEEFVNVFGLTIQIGNKIGKFFLSESIFIENNISPHELIKIIDANVSDFIQDFFIRFNRLSRGISVDIVLAYCIDTSKYERYINKKK